MYASMVVERMLILVYAVPYMRTEVVAKVKALYSQHSFVDDSAEALFSGGLVGGNIVMGIPTN